MFTREKDKNKTKRGRDWSIFKKGNLSASAKERSLRHCVIASQKTEIEERKINESVSLQSINLHN